MTNVFCLTSQVDDKITGSWMDGLTTTCSRSITRRPRLKEDLIVKMHIFSVRGISTALAANADNFD